MNAMKGPGAVVIACQLTAETAVNVVRYLDGTWGVTKAGVTLGIWETDELDECFNVFALQAGIKDPHAPLTVLLRVRQTADCALN
jgi:hypothetical protein